MLKTILLESALLLVMFHTTSYWVDVQCAAYWYGTLAVLPNIAGLWYTVRKDKSTKGMSIKFGYALSIPPHIPLLQHS